MQASNRGQEEVCRRVTEGSEEVCRRVTEGSEEVSGLCYVCGEAQWMLAGGWGA